MRCDAECQGTAPGLTEVVPEGEVEVEVLELVPVTATVQEAPGAWDQVRESVGAQGRAHWSAQEAAKAAEVQVQQLEHFQALKQQSRPEGQDSLPPAPAGVGAWGQCARTLRRRGGAGGWAGRTGQPWRNQEMRVRQKQLHCC